jgi:hypothetical protein
MIKINGIDSNLTLGEMTQRIITDAGVGEMHDFIAESYADNVLIVNIMTRNRFNVILDEYETDQMVGDLNLVYHEFLKGA